MSEEHLDIHALDDAFDRDRFLLVQKRLAINEKYFISDEQNQRILFVERPQHLLQQLASLGVMAIAIVAAIGLGFGIGGLLDQFPDWLRGIIGLLTGGAVAGFGVVGGLRLQPLRHVTFYRDDTRREKLLSITQDNRVQILFAYFTVFDDAGKPLAKLRKNQLTNVFRRRWVCQYPDGRAMCVAMEDSVVLAILRRLIGPMMGLLRTNYIIVAGDGFPERLLGKFDRKFTLFDQYVLDMSADPLRELDRRVVLAAGVLLDTGERR